MPTISTPILVFVGWGGVLLFSLGGCGVGGAPGLERKLDLRARIANSEIVACGSVVGAERSPELYKTRPPSVVFEAREVTVDFHANVVLKGALDVGRIRFTAFEPAKAPFSIDRGDMLIVILRVERGRLRIYSDYRELGLLLPKNVSCNSIGAEKDPAKAVVRAILPQRDTVSTWQVLDKVLIELRGVVDPLWYSNEIEQAVSRSASSPDFPSACFALVSVFPESDRCLDQIDLRFSAADVNYAATLRGFRVERRQELVRHLEGEYCALAASKSTGGVGDIPDVVYLANHHDALIRNAAQHCLDRLARPRRLVP